MKLSRAGYAKAGILTCTKTDAQDGLGCGGSVLIFVLFLPLPGGFDVIGDRVTRGDHLFHNNHGGLRIWIEGIGGGTWMPPRAREFDRTLQVMHQYLNPFSLTTLNKAGVNRGEDEASSCAPIHIAPSLENLVKT